MGIGINNLGHVSESCDVVGGILREGICNKSLQIDVIRTNLTRRKYHQGRTMQSAVSGEPGQVHVDKTSTRSKRQGVDAHDEERNAIPKMVYAVCQSQKHVLEGHVERPERIDGILEYLHKANEELKPYVKRIETDRRATQEDIERCHTYLDTVEKEIEKGEGDEAVCLADEFDPDGSTYGTQDSVDCGLRASGAVLEMVDAVCNGRAHMGFGVVRPPGHHATRTTPLGFCLFNSVAIAAKYAQKNYGLKRIFIVDFDLHNGNGTAELFWKDPSVMVVDIHEGKSVYDPPDFVPSNVDAAGAAEGYGFTVNLPLPTNAGHESVERGMKEIVRPLADRFQPELVLVSAGFDGHEHDPFAMLSYQDFTYYMLGSLLREIADDYCDGKIVYSLEGGYDYDALGRSVVEMMRGALGIPSHCSIPPQEHREDATIQSKVSKRIAKLKSIHGIE